MNSPKGLFRDLHSLAWAAAILAASAAFGLFVARPAIARAHLLNQEVQTEQAQVAARYESLGVLSKAQKEAAALSARVADFDQRIPAAPMLGDFLEELARFAQKRNLQSDTVQPGEPIRMPKVVAQPLAIKVRGSFSDVHGLLQDIEHMQRLTRVEQFMTTTDAERPGSVTAELNLKIYFLPKENEARTG